MKRNGTIQNIKYKIHLTLRHDEIPVCNDECVPLQRHLAGVRHGARLVRAERRERGLNFAQVAAQFLPHAAEVQLERWLAVRRLVAVEAHCVDDVQLAHNVPRERAAREGTMV